MYVALPTLIFKYIQLSLWTCTVEVRELNCPILYYVFIYIFARIYYTNWHKLFSIWLPALKYSVYFRGHSTCLYNTVASFLMAVCRRLFVDVPCYWEGKKFCYPKIYLLGYWFLSWFLRIKRLRQKLWPSPITCLKEIRWKNLLKGRAHQLSFII